MTAALEIWQHGLDGFTEQQILDGFWRAKAIFQFPPTVDEFAKLLSSEAPVNTKTYVGYTYCMGRRHGVVGWDAALECYICEDVQTMQRVHWWPSKNRVVAA